MNESIHNHGIKQTQTEAYSPWQNHAESAIRELKKSVHHLMPRIKAPKKLWDFCASYSADIRMMTAHPLYSLQGRMAYEFETGNTPDITEYIKYDWYQLIWYYDSASFPEDKELIGRWLEVMHQIRQALCYWILPETGIPIA